MYFDDHGASFSDRVPHGGPELEKLALASFKRRDEHGLTNRKITAAPVTTRSVRCLQASMGAVSTDPADRLEAVLGMGRDAPRKRMLIIVNPYATTVSDRLKNLVVYALRGSYDVDAIDTQARNHATELTREAAREGYDVVVAFGGDGTVNEAANGLVGSKTPLTCLPGGRTNVYCRLLGIPVDVVDATEHLLRMADEWRPRAVDVGFAGDRAFLFSAGIGLDASVVKQVDAHPRLKVRFGEWYYAATAVRTFNRHYLINPPRFELAVGDRSLEGVSAIFQNGSQYTWFGRRPVQLAPGAELDSGNLTGIVLRRASPLDIPTIIFRALSKHASFTRHRQVEPFAAADGIEVRSLDGRRLPLEVDGDYVGDAETTSFRVAPLGLQVVA